MNKYLAHLKTISKHKLIVGYYCFKCGQYKRGLLHDNSKFGVTEFFTSAHYFQVDSSHIDAEKKEKEYSLAWQHHKGRNPHHWEYWIDELGTRKNKPIKIPYPYLIEMICDWIGAGKVYNKNKWTTADPLAFFERKKSHIILNARTEKVVIYLLELIKNHGLDTFCYAVKHPEKSKVLENYVKGD